MRTSEMYSIILTLRFRRLLALNLAITMCCLIIGVDNSMAWAKQLHTQQDCLYVVTVINTADAGMGTLRQALNDVCEGGTIDFDSTLTDQVIRLTSAELVISKNLSIANINAHNLVISGGDQYRVFHVLEGATVMMSGLAISEGSAIGDGGGAIINEGILTLSNMVFSANRASAGGGALYSIMDICIFQT